MKYGSQLPFAPQHDGRLLLQTLSAVLGAALILPICMIVAGAAAPVQLMFPIYTSAVALWIQTHYRPVLPAFIVALFAFSPFLRRLADYHAGFELFSPLLLGPYFALLPTIPSFVRRVLGQRSGPNSPFMILALCITYAVFVSLPEGRILSTAVDLIRWVLPMALCTFVMDKPQDVPAVKRCLVVSLFFILPLLTIYGIQQYVNPQGWDVLWMNNTRNAAVSGLPYPYQVRVFSMMNSALSLAVFVTSGLIIIAGEGGLGMVVAAGALPVLALTLDRTAWIQCVIGAVVLVLQAPPQRRMTFAVGVLLVGLGAVGAVTGGILPPLAQNTLDQRLATFSSLSNDHSADERLQVYDSFFSRLAESPLGEGFGANNSTSSLAEKRTLISLDSALLEIVITFGVIMGTLVLTTIAALTWMAFQARRSNPGRLVGGTALLFSILATSPLGSNLTGEVGVLTWVALGVLLAAPSAASYRTPFVMPANARRLMATLR